MEKLPSKNVERLLIRIRDAEGGKLSLSSLSDPDRDRLKILEDRGLVQFGDAYYPDHVPGSHVYYVGPSFKSVSLNTAGADYLSDLSYERKSRWLRFGRDVVMMILGSVITLVLSFLFNNLT